MMMTNAQIRRTAKDSLRGSWGLAIGVILLNYLFNNGGRLDCWLDSSCRLDRHLLC